MPPAHIWFGIFDFQPLKITWEFMYMMPAQRLGIEKTKRESMYNKCPFHFKMQTGSNLMFELSAMSPGFQF